VHTGAPEKGAGAYLDYARRVLSPVPYAVAKFASPAVRRLVRTALDPRHFDVAVCDFLSASLNFPRQHAIPCVLFQHNVESALWTRQAAHEPNLLKRAAFTLEAAKMSRYEPATVRRFGHVIAVSNHDRTLMSAMTDPERITVVPTGVDVQQYRAAAQRAAVEPVAMFLGSMDWEANIDAVDYFCREVWPAVRAAVPTARFRIVGRAPHPRVTRLASESIEVTGTVPSVVDHLAETAAFVVPLRIGGGTRLKIFEAMAAGRAVVSTSVGAEGLEVSHGHDVLLADTPEAFAAATIEVLRNPARRDALGKAASDTAARHDWSSVVNRFDDALNRAVWGHATAGAHRAETARVPA
jgi:glycosyltransferase involved in cell wall biosynthesis